MNIFIYFISLLTFALSRPRDHMHYCHAGPCYGHHLLPPHFWLLSFLLHQKPEHWPKKSIVSKIEFVIMQLGHHYFLLCYLYQQGIQYNLQNWQHWCLVWLWNVFLLPKFFTRTALRNWNAAVFIVYHHLHFMTPHILW